MGDLGDVKRVHTLLHGWKTQYLKKNLTSPSHEEHGSPVGQKSGTSAVTRTRRWSPGPSRTYCARKLHKRVVGSAAKSRVPIPCPPLPPRRWWGNASSATHTCPEPATTNAATPSPAPHRTSLPQHCYAQPPPRASHPQHRYTHPSLAPESAAVRGWLCAYTLQQPGPRRDGPSSLLTMERNRK